MARPGKLPNTMVSLRTSLTVVTTCIVSILLVSIDASRDYTIPRPRSIGQRHRFKIHLPLLRSNTTAVDVAHVPEVTTATSRPSLLGGLVLNSRASLDSLSSLSSRTDSDEDKHPTRVHFSKIREQDFRLQPKQDANVPRELRKFSTRRGSSNSRRSRRRHQGSKRRRRRRRNKKRESRKAKKQQNKYNRRNKLTGAAKDTFNLINRNEERRNNRKPHKGKDSPRRRKGRKSSKNKKIVIAEHVNIPRLKQKCKTQPMRQKIQIKDCSPKLVMNNFCYGQCISVYIPEARGTGYGDPSLVSCGFCRPRDLGHKIVPLRCAGGKNGRVKLKRHRVPYVKECRCMEQKVQI